MCPQPYDEMYRRRQLKVDSGQPLPPSHTGWNVVDICANCGCHITTHYKDSDFEAWWNTPASLTFCPDCTPTNKDSSYDQPR